MPPEWFQDFEIDLLPLRVRFGEHTYTQGVDLDERKFYQLVDEYHSIPKTTLPSPSQVVDLYRHVAKKGDEILSIHLTSKLSGTFSVIEAAARELEGEILVHPFDSGAGSAVMGFMCREARQMARKGSQVKDIIARLEQIKAQLTVLFTLDRLDFAHLNGRIGTLQSVFGSMLMIKPIIRLKDGLLYMSEKVRTRQKALARVIEIAREKLARTRVNLAVVHAAAPETAMQMMKDLREIIECDLSIITDLSIPVAANLGPGTIGIAAYPVEYQGS